MPCKAPFLAAAVSFAALCPSVNAQSEAPLDFLFKDDGTYAPFESKSANALMTAEEFAEYQSLLSDHKCDAAALVLNRAFVRNYPQFVQALKNEDVSHNRDYSAWKSYAGSRFDEFRLCKVVANVRETQRELTAFGGSPPKYAFREVGQTENDHSLVTSRDLSLRSLVDLAHKGYPPALVKIAEFVRRGDLFDVGADVEFYLLTRARHLGDDSGGLDARLAELAASLPAGRREDIANKARAAEAVVKHIFHRGQKL